MSIRFAPQAQRKKLDTLWFSPNNKCKLNFQIYNVKDILKSIVNIGCAAMCSSNILY